MEKKKKSYLSKAVFGLLIVAFTVCCIIAAPITEAKGTLWSLFPPVIAIGLALITKEVYSSLFVGILSGGIIYAAASGTGFEGTFKAVVQDGLITNLSNAYNVGILVFLVVLGITRRAAAVPTVNGRRLISRADVELHCQRFSSVC